MNAPDTADEKPVAPRDAIRAPRPDRKRRAHWRGVLRGIQYSFTYKPADGRIIIRRYRSRTTRTITMGELLEALQGQRLLPL